MPSEVITDQIVLRGLILGILGRVAVEQRPCRICREEIYRIPVRDQPKPVWYSKNGNPHANYCSQAKPPTQPALFDTAPDPL